MLAIIFILSAVVAFNTYCIYKLRKHIEMIDVLDEANTRDRFSTWEFIDSLKAKIYTLEQRIKSLPTK